MKRIVSIVMLFLMAVSAVQPTVAFHFCKGTFVSVGLGGGDGCCCGKAAADSPCGSEEPPLPGNRISEPYSSCCSDYPVELSTDDFQVSASEYAASGGAAIVPLFLPADELPGYAGRDDARMIRYLSPPGGVARSGMDILALICTLCI
jgi:hypothetical protein